MAQPSRAGLDADTKVNRLEEHDLALTNPQSSQRSSDTVPDECHRWLDRYSSVSSTAGTVPPSRSVTSVVKSQSMYQFGAPARNLRANSTGSKRSFDVNADEEDTPTKRAKELSSSARDAYTWGQSPAHACLPDRLSIESEQIELEQLDSHAFSDDLLASGQSSSSYADLCCGESNVLHDRQLFRSHTEHIRPACEPPAKATLQRTHSEPPPQVSNPKFGDGQHDVIEMIRNLYETELKLLPDPAYMLNHGAEHQPKFYIDHSMRTIVISWLVEVSCEYELHQETLFLAAALLDRFMSIAKVVPRSNLQLISVACMLIASKHEEERHPSVQDFTSIADNCFQTGDLLKMESTVLQCLGFRINAPSSHTFLSLFLQGVTLSLKAQSLASYLTELALLEYNVLNFPPSVVAAAAVLLAQSYDDVYSSGFQLQRVSGYSPQVLGCCMEELLELQHRAAEARDINGPFTAVKDKYHDLKWHSVSHTAPHAQLPERIYQSASQTASEDPEN